MSELDMSEAQLQRLLLGRLQAILGADAIWRANAGAATGASGRHVAFGRPGQADLSGILPGGKRLEVEVKSETGQQRPDQHDFEQSIASRGGLYLLARPSNWREVVAVVEGEVARAKRLAELKKAMGEAWGG